MSAPVRVDIVSDVMCPWCIIGFQQLQAACNATGIGCVVHWHPFELNPDMPTEGQDLREHLAQKYGTTPAQSVENRNRLVELGDSLGFTFTFGDNNRMYNTFLAHQMIRFAADQGLAHTAKMALFTAHFTENRPVGDIDTLVEIGAEIGLDREALATALRDGTLADAVREEQTFWIEQGISGVPAMVFDGKFLFTGAQGVENYATILQQVLAKRAA